MGWITERVADLIASGRPIAQKALPCPLCGHELLLHDSGIPLAEYYDAENKRPRGFDIRNLVNTEPYDLTQAYLQTLDEQIANGQGLFFYGKNGGGKTLLACTIGIVATQRLYSVRFGLTSAYLDAIRSWWGNDGQSTLRGELWRKSMIALDLLILDDLGSDHKGSGWAATELFRLLNDRLAAQKATIITSQLSLDKIRQGLAGGDSDQAHRLASRVEPLIEVEVLSKGDYRHRQGEIAKRRLLQRVSV